MGSRHRLLLGLLGACAVLVSGCGVGEFGGMYNVSLPGGADTGDHPYRVKVRFRDVLDLVPQSAVKVNDVAVGKVDAIDLAEDGWTAEVTVIVNGDVRLPANAEAKLRQSSLLGEKFVELAEPSSGAAKEQLSDGALIPVERTNRNPEVEEVFGALSMLLNGGGITQLQTITKEINTTLSGREPEIRSLLSNVDKLVSTLDSHKGEITRALDGVNRLSATLNAQLGNIRTALDGLEPGIRVLSEQRQQLVGMLQALDKLSGVATDVVNRSKDNIIADLKLLGPILHKLGESGQNLPKALELLFTYPFPDSAVPAVRGDYTNAFIKVDLNLAAILDNLGTARQPIFSLPNSSGGAAQQPRQQAPNAQAVPGSPGSDPPRLPLQLPNLQLPQLPLPGQSGQRAQSGQSGQRAQSGQSGQNAPGGLGGLLGSLLGGGR